MIVRVNCSCGTSGTVEVNPITDDVDASCPRCRTVHAVCVRAGVVTVDGVEVWTVIS